MNPASSDSVYRNSHINVSMGIMMNHFKTGFTVPLAILFTLLAILSSVAEAASPDTDCAPEVLELESEKLHQLRSVFWSDPDQQDAFMLYRTARAEQSEAFIEFDLASRTVDETGSSLTSLAEVARFTTHQYVNDPVTGLRYRLNFRPLNPEEPRKIIPVSITRLHSEGQAPPLEFVFESFETLRPRFAQTSFQEPIVSRESGTAVGSILDWIVVDGQLYSFGHFLRKGQDVLFTALGWGALNHNGILEFSRTFQLPRADYSPLYRHFDFLTYFNGAVFYLQVGDIPTLFEFRSNSNWRPIDRGRIKFLASTPTVNPYGGFRGEIAEFNATELNLPAGLYSDRRNLYLLLRRGQGAERNPDWFLVPYDFSDPDTPTLAFDREVHLPTTQDQLKVLPGREHWIVIEQAPPDGNEQLHAWRLATSLIEGHCSEEE